MDGCVLSSRAPTGHCVSVISDSSLRGSFPPQTAAYIRSLGRNVKAFFIKHHWWCFTCFLILCVFLCIEEWYWIGLYFICYFGFTCFTCLSMMLVAGFLHVFYFLLFVVKHFINVHKETHSCCHKKKDVFINAHVKYGATSSVLLSAKDVLKILIVTHWN